MKKMLFVVNPKAGKTTLKNSLADVIDIFIKMTTKLPFILHRMRTTRQG